MSGRSLRYDDFAVRLETPAEGEYFARILHSVAGGGGTRFELPVHPEAIDELMHAVGGWIRATGGDRHMEPVVFGASGSSGGVLQQGDPEVLGRGLHRAVLGGRVGEAWAFHQGSLARERRRGLRLRLVFDHATLAYSPLAGLPWELIFQDSARGFLASDRRTQVVRHLDVEHPTLLPPTEPPLRVLAVAASPNGYPSLQLASEVARIRTAWEDKGAIELEFERQITLPDLRERLLRDGYHVLHFMGHGEFHESELGRAEGALLFEVPSGRAERISATRLAGALRGLEDLRLVVLNACDSARFPRLRGTDPFRGVAAALVLAGIPAVVAMQFPISDRAAIAFGGGLHRALAAERPDPIEAAVAEGRQAIADDNPGSLEWATPVLFSRLAAGAILEGRREGPGRQELRRRILDFGHLIEEKTRGFVGRRFVFDAIDEFRRSAGRGYFQIVAEPGIGKSAMVAEMVRRHGWVHHFNQRASNVTRPEAFLSNICSQLVVAHGLDVLDLPPESIRDGSYLVHLLGQVSRGLDPGKTIVILIDALDESNRDGLAPGVNPLYLPPSLPEGIVVVLTTRPERPERYPRFHGPLTPPMELDPRGKENLSDIREYIAGLLPRPGIRTYLEAQELTEERFAEEMTMRSDGNFMYLSYVLPDIECGDYLHRMLDEVPVGLLNYYREHFARMRGRDRAVWLHETLPVLGALAVARDALPFELIHAFSGVEDPRHVREVLGEIRHLLSVTKRETAAGSIDVYRVYHETFFEFLRDSPELAIDLQAAHRRVVEAYTKGRVEGLEDLAGPEPW
jgi:hypothetical protein